MDYVITSPQTYWEALWSFKATLREPNVGPWLCSGSPPPIFVQRKKGPDGEMFTPSEPSPKELSDWVVLHGGTYRATVLGREDFPAGKPHPKVEAYAYVYFTFARVVD